MSAVNLHPFFCLWWRCCKLDCTATIAVFPLCLLSTRSDSHALEFICVHWAECRHHKYQKCTVNLYSALACGLIYSSHPNAWKNKGMNVKTFSVEPRRVHSEDGHTFEIMWIYCKCLGCPKEWKKKNGIHFFPSKIQLFMITRRCPSRAQRRPDSPAVMDWGILQDVQIAWQTRRVADLHLPGAHSYILRVCACVWLEADELRSVTHLTRLLVATNIHLNHSWKHFTLCPGEDRLV